MAKTYKKRSNLKRKTRGGKNTLKNTDSNSTESNSTESNSTETNNLKPEIISILKSHNDLIDTFTKQIKLPTGRSGFTIDTTTIESDINKLSKDVDLSDALKELKKSIEEKEKETARLLEISMSKGGGKRSKKQRTKKRSTNNILRKLFRTFTKK